MTKQLLLYLNLQTTGIITFPQISTAVFISPCIRESPMIHINKFYNCKTGSYLIFSFAWSLMLLSGGNTQAVHSNVLCEFPFSSYTVSIKDLLHAGGFPKYFQNNVSNNNGNSEKSKVSTMMFPFSCKKKNFCWRDACGSILDSNYLPSRQPACGSFSFSASLWIL